MSLQSLTLKFWFILVLIGTYLPACQSYATQELQLQEVKNEDNNTITIDTAKIAREINDVETQKWDTFLADRRLWDVVNVFSYFVLFLLVNNGFEYFEKLLQWAFTFLDRSEYMPFGIPIDLYFIVMFVVVLFQFDYDDTSQYDPEYQRLGYHRLWPEIFVRPAMQPLYRFIMSKEVSRRREQIHQLLVQVMDSLNKKLTKKQMQEVTVLLKQNLKYLSTIRFATIAKCLSNLKTNYNTPEELLNTFGIYLIENCTICLDELNGGVTPGCGHLFHEKCLKNWLRESDLCPNCKSNITNKNDIYNLTKFIEFVQNALNDIHLH